MTVTWSLLEDGFDETDGTVYTIPSVDPADNDDILIALLSDDTAGGLEAPTSVVGNGIAYTLVADIPYSTIAAPTRRLFVYEGSHATPSAGTIVVTFPATQGGLRWIVIQGDGIHATAFPQNAENTAAADAGGLTNEATFGGAFAAASSGVIAFLARNTSTSPTPETGWSQIGSTVASVTPNASLACFWRPDNDPTPSPATWTGSARSALIVLEVQAASTLTAAQKATYVVALENLLGRCQGVIGRLLARRQQGTSVTTQLTEIRAIQDTLRAKWDELLTDATDIDAVTDAIDADLTTLLAAIGAVGVDPPEPVALVKGLMTRHTAPPGGASGVNGWNPIINWSTLQATQGGAIGGAGKTELDALVAAMPGTEFCLRPFIGWGAPQWAKDICGSMTIKYAQNPGADEDVIRWFDPAFSALYDDFIVKLAALYDGQIPLIFATAAMVVYGEPCLKQTNNLDNRTTLLAAGYTRDDDLATFYAGFDSLTAFTETRIGCAYNDYQYINSAGEHDSDRGIRDQLMDYHRTLFGERAVMQNNSIRPQLFGSSVYTRLKQMHDTYGTPIRMQTSTWVDIDDNTAMTQEQALLATLDFCVNLGCHAIELPNGHSLSNATLAAYDTLLQGAS